MNKKIRLIKWCVYKRHNLYLRFFILAVMLLSQTLFSQTYNYDLNGRLTGACYTNGTQVKYTYDPAGNIFNISGSPAQNTSPPVLTIQAPSPGNTTTSTPLAINGTATGANPVIFVFHQLNNGIWQLASTANQWTNWTASAALISGTNSLAVLAQDAAGNTTSTQLSVTFVPPPPFWTPTQLGTNLTLWLDAANTNTITLNGNRVSQWNDLSGYGNNVANTNTSLQPIFLQAGINNLPSISFTASGVGLYGTSNFGVSGSAPRVLAAVMNAGSIYTGTLQPSEAFGVFIIPAGTIYAADTYYSAYAPGPSLNFSQNSDVYFGEYLNGVLSAYFNGNFFGSASATPNTVPGPIEIGARLDGNALVSMISEVVYVRTGLPVSQQQQLEGYLAWKWGLQASLPLNHPYRYAAPLVAVFSNPTIQAQFVAGQGLQLKFSGAANQSYIVQSTTNLTAPIVWQPIATNSADGNGNWQFADTNSVSSNPARFYRVTGN